LRRRELRFCVLFLTAINRVRRPGIKAVAVAGLPQLGYDPARWEKDAGHGKA